MKNRFLDRVHPPGARRYVARRSDLLEDTMVVLRYFDTVNLADRICCPTLLVLGLEDDLVPAKTVYGIANHLAVP